MDGELLFASVHAVNEPQDNFKHMDNCNDTVTNVTENCCESLRVILGPRKSSLAGVHVQSLMLVNTEHSNEIEELLDIVVGSNSNDIYWLSLFVDLKYYLVKFEEVFRLNTTLVDLSVVVSSQDMVCSVGKILSSNKTLIALTAYLDVSRPNLSEITAAIKENTCIEKLSILHWASCAELLEALSINRTIRLAMVFPSNGKRFCGGEADLLLLSEVLELNPTVELFRAPLQRSSDCGALQFAKAFQKSNMRFFDAKLYNMSSKQTSGFFKQSPMQLDFVKFWKTCVDRESMASLLTSCRTLKLQTLDLSNCCLGQEAVSEVLAEILRESFHLRSLSIEGNVFTGEQYSCLVKSIKQHPALTWITFGSNDHGDALTFLEMLLGAGDVFVGYYSVCGEIENLGLLVTMFQASLPKNTAVLGIRFVALSGVMKMLGERCLVPETSNLCFFSEAEEDCFESMRQLLAKNRNFVSGHMKMILSFSLLKFCKNSMMADLVNLPELVWKFAAGWVSVLSRRDIDPFLDV
eukprot:TRINITY_DN5053_c0_g1_i6.p1 TRINITY_DN5053_c0_g1~~TRINITY_DN5053_c0_g1_i6.p1  ORF type:complete len:555 (-),score=148.83 TRINITY_DN5053_c0_g1_i6:484-2049(-)